VVWYASLTEILSDTHDSKVAGHFGQFKTLERVKNNFFWPNMDKDVEEYVRSCDSCQRNKTSRHKKFGMLQPLEIPYRPWTSISMDFIVGLPGSSGFTKIWVIVDRFSKMSHYIPLPTLNKTEDLAKLFLKEVWRLHGLPDDCEGCVPDHKSTLRRAQSSANSYKGRSLQGLFSQRRV
jgi:hypothetical protein